MNAAPLLVNLVETWARQVEQFDSLDARAEAWGVIEEIEQSLSVLKQDLTKRIHADLAEQGGWKVPVQTPIGPLKACYGSGSEKWADETFGAVVSTALENPVDPETGELLDPVTAVVTALKRCASIGRYRVGAMKQYRIPVDVYREVKQGTDRPPSFRKA